MRIYEEINALPPAGIGNLLPKKILADLRNRRNEFRNIVKKQAKANEAARTSAKTQLEADWGRFETEVQKYAESVGAQINPQINQQRATFKLQAEAQLKAGVKRLTSFRPLRGHLQPNLAAKSTRRSRA
jgi:hypothetical protein